MKNCTANSNLAHPCLFHIHCWWLTNRNKPQERIVSKHVSKICEAATIVHILARVSSEMLLAELDGWEIVDNQPPVKSEEASADDSEKSSGLKGDHARQTTRDLADNNHWILND